MADSSFLRKLLPFLNSEEAKIKALWEKIRPYLKRDIANVWSPDVKKEFEALEVELARLKSVLGRLHKFYKLDEVKYSQEIANIEELLGLLRKVKSDENWVKQVHDDLERLLKDVKYEERNVKAISGNFSYDPSFAQNGIHYLGILETYAVRWSIEKTARDILQNFFDGNGGTLDGVKFEIKKEEDCYSVRIESHAEYDFRQLLHLGGTTKSDDPNTVGYFGEGAKIAPLVLLRDYGFSQVAFASQDWNLNFLLGIVPAVLYTGNKKGLFAKVDRTKKKIKGNFVEMKTENEAFAKAFLDAKELFYHSKNLDFRDPTINVTGIGGFKYIPSEKDPKTKPKGNLYVAGQRRHFDKEEWNTVENFSIWVWSNDVLRKDRDRGIVNWIELRNEVVPKIVKAANIKDLTKAMYTMEDLWSSDLPSYTPGYGIIEAIVKRLKEENVKLDFGEKHLAHNLVVSKSVEGDFAQAGFKICHSFFADLGMKTSERAYSLMIKTKEVELTQKDQRRVEILYEAVRGFGRGPRDIQVVKEKRIIRNLFMLTHRGSHKNVMLPVNIEIRALREGFAECLGTYLHEMDHDYGTDGQREFSDALTDTIKLVVEKIISNPQVFIALKKRWDEK